MEINRSSRKKRLSAGVFESGMLSDDSWFPIIMAVSVKRVSRKLPVEVSLKFLLGFLNGAKDNKNC